MKSCALLFLLLLGTSLAQSNGEPPSGNHRVDSPDIAPFDTTPAKDPLPTGTQPTPTLPTQTNPTGSTPTRPTNPTGSTPSKPTQPAASTPQPTEATKPTAATPQPTETPKPTASTPKPTETPKTTAATPKPTETPKPTAATPQPTKTPKPTAATPQPTKTPKPTASTPKPTEATKPTASTPKPTEATKPTASTPKPTTPTNPTTPTTIPTTPSPPPTSPTPPPTPSSCGFVPDCPLRGTKYIANPCADGCQKYFVCSEGAWESKACFPWENFHPERLSCDFWFNVDCSWLRPTTPSPILTTWPDLTTPVPMTPKPPCNYVPTCPANGTKVVPDPCGCQKFYECVEGKAVSKACMPWENFDPTKLECVFMFDVDCNWPYYDPTKEPTSTTPPPSTKPTPAPSVPTSPTPAPTQPTPTTTKPTVATSPTPTPTQATKEPTPAPTTATTAPAKPTTVDPNLCTFKPTCPPTGTEKIPIPCEGYCTKYFECSDGIPILRTCSKWIIPQKFHPTKKECQRIGVDCNWWKKEQH